MKSKGLLFVHLGVHLWNQHAIMKGTTFTHQLYRMHEQDSTSKKESITGKVNHYFVEVTAWRIHHNWLLLLEDIHNLFHDF